MLTSSTVPPVTIRTTPPVQGETITFALNNDSSGNPQLFSTDVDIIKIALWFYDNRHDDSSSVIMDDIDLRLQRSSNGTSWTTVLTSATTDHKERVFYNGTIGGYHWRFQIIGDTVANPNEIPAHWAVLWEDSDRESGDVQECVRSEE